MTGLVILRMASDLPAGFIPPQVDGAVLDLPSTDGVVRCAELQVMLADGQSAPVVAVPTARTEFVDDATGRPRLAQVFEIQP